MTSAQDVLAGSFSVGGAALGVVVLAAFIAVVVGYSRFTTTGFRQREVTTQLSSVELGGIFEQRVCGIGWSIVERGNPVVAQSGPVAGIRQQIVMQWTDEGGQRVAKIWVPRYSKKLTGAPKAYRLRLRMGSFLAEVRRRDARAVVTP
ncbi:MAG: hypothetical protein JWP40_4774 [Blastococcus sp.]|nr:hypothetical protein [Blastococcus sp.]